MSEPDFREWFRWRGELYTTLWPREIQPVLDAWEENAGRKVYIRLTFVNMNWLCIDGWRRIPLDEGFEPTEMDIPRVH